MDIDKELEYYQAQKIANDKYHLPQNTKPCVSLLLNIPREEGGLIGRAKVGLMIATDLRNNSETEEQIKKRLDTWNRQNLPLLPQKEIKGILKAIYKPDFKGNYLYKYSCNGKYAPLLLLEGACIGKEFCNYYRDNYANKGHKAPPVNYIATGWQYVLTPREQLLLFYVIPQLERLKKVYPGYTLCTTYRELHKHTGINQRYFSEILQALKDYGLISFIPGTQRLWEHKATEITRIIPPPQIPKEYLNKILPYSKKEFRQTIKKQRGKNGQNTTDNLPGQRHKGTVEA